MSVRAKDLAPFRAFSPAQRDAVLSAFTDAVKDLSEQRAQRLIEIVRRAFFDRITPATLRAELGISRQQFFSDRREAFRRVRGLIESGAIRQPRPVAVVEPSVELLTQARSLYRAGLSRRAIALLEQLDWSSLEPGNRFDGMRLLVDSVDDIKALPAYVEGIRERARRWADDSVSGTASWHLARAAEHWLQVRVGAMTSGYRRDSLRNGSQAIELVRSATDMQDRATIIAFCRMLMEAAPLLIVVGDAQRAETVMSEVREILGRYRDLSHVLLGEAQTMSAQVHWFDTSTLLTSRAERESAYLSVVDSCNVRATWSCLYFEIRDQMLQRNGRRAVALAEEFFRSVCASDTIDWRLFAQATLINAYLMAGQLDDAERCMAEQREAEVPSRMLATVSLDAARHNYRAVYDRASDLVDVFGRRSIMLAKIGALQLRARAGYHLGKRPAAVTDIEEAVAVYESQSSRDPLLLRTLYDDAFMISGRRRYQDALRSIMVESHTPSDARHAEHLAGLSDRQFQVARLAASGLTNLGIASELNISPRTVEKHLDFIFGHLNIRSRRQLPHALQIGERSLL
jgi:DNA-binding CsgD family transcriptional regulator